jgi:arginyl-tRNA synthetase
MDELKQKIITLLKKHTKLKDINIEIPPDSAMGDYAFPCFVLSKKLKMSPNEIAKDLVSKINTGKFVKEVRAVGPYLNFFVDKEGQSLDILKKIFKEKDKHGKCSKKNKKILVEFAGPNTNKPLHLGHVRNICLGSSLVNVLDSNGFTVHPVNINNDRGIHICKSMLAYQKWGKSDSPTKSKLKSDFFVGKYYVMFSKKVKENPSLEDEARELLSKWEAGDKETIELWKKMNKWAFDGFEETYKKFNVDFKKEYYESEHYEKGKEIILNGLKKGIFKKNAEGAILANLKKQGYGEKVLLRSDGTSVYITQDVNLAKVRYEDFKFDKLVYVVATEQNYHFKVLFEILKLLKYSFADKLYHFAYGMVNLTTGKMKSREGTVVDADNLIEDMTNLALKETKSRDKSLSSKELQDRAEKIALGAIRFYILKNDPIKDMLFDPEKSISFEGETGPYLQYTYARINSILRKYGKKVEVGIHSSLLSLKEEVELIRMLGEFENVIKKVGENYKIHVLARYLLELAQTFNNFYHAYPVLKADENLMKARLLLVSCVKQVLKNGLNLLGIDILERM